MAECDYAELPTNENEEIVEKVKKFLQAGCGCSLGFLGLLNISEEVKSIQWTL